MSSSKGARSAVDESRLLADALERALGRDQEPSSVTVPAQTDLLSLVNLARRVEGSGHAVGPSEAFQAAARARLVASMRQAAASSARQAHQPRFRLAVSSWFGRAAAALSAVALAGAATAGASASSLPGEPLYVIKQASEQVALEIAPDDASRQRVLLGQAETRLDETSRLLEQGRDADAGQNALRYGDLLDGTTGTAAEAESIETSLQVDHTRLTSLLAAAPPPARLGLQRALQATDRGLARARRAHLTEPDVLPQEPRPTVVQPAISTRLETTPTTKLETTPTLAATPTPGPAAVRAEPDAEQSHRPAALDAREGGSVAGAASRPVAPPERRAPPVSVVHKGHGPSTPQVQPTRHSRP